MTLARMADLNKRLMVSTVAILIIATLLVFSKNLLVITLLVVSVASLVAIGIWEYARFARAKGLRPALLAMMVVAVCEVFAFFSAHKLIIFPQSPAIILAAGAVIFFMMHFKDTSDALVHVAVEFFGVCYVAVPLSFLLAILYPIATDGTVLDGRWWLVYLIVVTKVTDAGAYFVGRLWGKHPLAPILSPNKTIEGAIAGFLCAVLCSLFMSFLGSQVAPDLLQLPFWDALWLGSLIGILGQIGDLAESLLKRDAVVKDSNALPGLGGVLDMVDSLLLTAPIVYFYLKITL